MYPPLVRLAALFHDVGKSCLSFIDKLNAGRSIPSAYRHEWISLRLFELFVNGEDDQSWLQRLAILSADDAKALETRLAATPFSSEQKPFKSLPPLAQAIGWLIISHHRLPTPSGFLDEKVLSCLLQNIDADWCGAQASDPQAIADCWKFPHGLPFSSTHWRQRASSAATALLKHNPRAVTLCDLHLARLALVLADHHYSGQPSLSIYGDATSALYANTDRRTGRLKQRLDEHLIGVEVNARRVARTLPHLSGKLPRLVHAGFREPSPAAFDWQNQSFALAESLRLRSSKQGFFGVNMASTGCGKTMANGRILYALSDPEQGARFTVALGLRTLTLQTGDAYRDRLRLGSDEMAVLVGDAAVRALHEHALEETHEGEESLLPEQVRVLYDGVSESDTITRWMGKNQPASKLLNAPVLVCTIDHLMPATEGIRGGHQIAPMLRLMTADLVLDEPDDFGMEDLPALTRLVHWTGLMGSRVLLSSATLPPALIEGLFHAYQSGREQFLKEALI